MKNNHLPIAVIGAGAGGLPAAVALAEAGFQVVLIEQGGEVKKESFKTNQYDFELGAPPWGQSSGNWRGPAKLQQGIGLGGSTLYFQAVSHYPEESVLSDWGLPFPVFRKYQAETVDFLQIAGEVQPEHSFNPLSEHLFVATKKLGWHARHAPVAILSEPHQGRPACNNCGLCVYGCRPGDKSSADNTWLPRAKKTGRVRILTNTRVEQLQLADEHRVKALKLTNAKGSSTLEVSAAVLAAGVLETPYLLSKSQQTHAPDGIGNQNIGHFLTATIWHSLLVSLEQITGSSHAGIPIDLLVEEFVSRGILLFQGRNLAGITGPASAAKYYMNQHSHVGLRHWMRETYPKLAGLAAYAESSVGYEDGILKIKDKTYNKALRSSDYQTVNEMRKLLHQWSETANAKVLAEMGSSEYPFIGAMYRGTCRMGLNPKDSAVDPDGRLWGYDNVVVSDASVLGRGLIANPSLTLQTLGLYIGRQLAQRLKQA